MLFKMTSEGRIAMSADKEAELRAEWAVNARGIQKEAVRQAALETLRELDSSSIRSIREWVAAQTGEEADRLKVIEEEAEAQRVLLRGVL